MEVRSPRLALQPHRQPYGGPQPSPSPAAPQAALKHCWLQHCLQPASAWGMGRGCRVGKGARAGRQPKYKRAGRRADGRLIHAAAPAGRCLLKLPPAATILSTLLRPAAARKPPAPRPRSKFAPCATPAETPLQDADCENVADWFHAFCEVHAQAAEAAQGGGRPKKAALKTKGKKHAGKEAAEGADEVRWQARAGRPPGC